uniref:Ubiquitin-like domain-containing protein n=1 Tax=Oryza brachyantha TaxID=4533 RepID=J3KWW4_ORYBR
MADTFVYLRPTNDGTGAPVGTESGGGAPLFYAANNGKDKTLKILLEQLEDVMESNAGLHEKPTVTYARKSPNVSTALTKTQVFVKHPHGTLSLQIDTDKDVCFLKEMVNQRIHLGFSGYFTYQLSTLEAGKPLSSYGIVKDSDIYMRARLHGGKRYRGRRFRGRRKLKTLSQFSLEHRDELLRSVELPDQSTSVELTSLGCTILSSLVHLFTAVFVSGRTWDGTIDMEGLIVVHGRVRIKKTSWEGLNSSRLKSDCARLTSMIREMFVQNNVHPPYLRHLLKKFDTLAGDFLEDHRAAFDLHMSSMSSLNRVNSVYQIRRSFDGWDRMEQHRFRCVANTCKFREDGLNHLYSNHLFRAVIMEGQKMNVRIKSNGIGAFFFIPVPIDQREQLCQLFECNSGVELMVPKYLGDFLAEVVFKFIEEDFDIRDVLMTCSTLGPSVTTSSSDGSSSSDSHSDSTSSPRKRKRSFKKKKPKRCSSSSDSDVSSESTRKRKRRHSTVKKSSRSRHSSSSYADSNASGSASKKRRIHSTVKRSSQRRHSKKCKAR